MRVRAIKSTFAMCVLVNLPLAVMLVAHFPYYSKSFIQLLGIYPGQYFFLLFFFPFIAYWTLHTRFLLIEYFDANKSRYTDLSSFYWKLFVRWKFGMPLFGILIGVPIAVADSLATSRGIDQLPPDIAIRGVEASNVVLEAVVESNPQSLLQDIRSRFHVYDYLNIDYVSLSKISEENISRVERNQRIVEHLAEDVLRDLSRNEGFVNRAKQSAQEMLDNLDPRYGRTEAILDASVYIQIILSPDLLRATPPISLALRVTNLIELVTVVYIAAHLACLGWILIFIRIRVMKKAELPSTLANAAASLVWVTLLFGLWPALRIYTIRETEIIFPTATALDAPLLVYVFCFTIILFLVGAFLKNQWLQIGSIVTGLLFSVISFVISLRDIFVMRQIIGSDASMGNVIMVGVASILVLTFVGTLLFPEQKTAKQPTKGSPDDPL